MSSFRGPLQSDGGEPALEDAGCKRADGEVREMAALIRSVNLPTVASHLVLWKNVRRFEHSLGPWRWWGRLSVRARVLDRLVGPNEADMNFLSTTSCVIVEINSRNKHTPGRCDL